MFTAIAHITREKIGSENEEMANVLSHIGNLHANTRDYDAAMKCFTEAFRIHKVILGEDDIALATDLQKCVWSINPWTTSDGIEPVTIFF